MQKIVDTMKESLRDEFPSIEPPMTSGGLVARENTGPNRHERRRAASLARRSKTRPFVALAR